MASFVPSGRSPGRRTHKATPQQNWRSNVNSSQDVYTVEREGVRSNVAVRRIQGGEVPTCKGTVDVARGSGVALLAQVNQLGVFKGMPDEQAPKPISKAVLREDRSLRRNLRRQGSYGSGTTKNVTERRAARSDDGLAWSYRVEGLGQTPAEEIERAKQEYEKRRQYLRNQAFNGSLSKIEHLRAAQDGREQYSPSNVASQHAIALGTPSSSRAEYDERRKFLKSNLTESERMSLAAKRGVGPFGF